MSSNQSGIISYRDKVELIIIHEKKRPLVYYKRLTSIQLPQQLNPINQWTVI